MKILFVQHAAYMSGSLVSLRTLIERAVVLGDVVTVVVPSREAKDYYSDLGAKIIIEFTPHFRHFKGYAYPLNLRGLAQVLLFCFRALKSAFYINRIVTQLQPDVIHLNSLVLPHLALLATIKRIPFVWHIRERVASEHWGIRRKILGCMIRRLPEKSIFISEEERNEFAMSIPNSEIIYNTIEIQSRSPTLKLPSEPLRALFIGGLDRIKGLHEVLSALTLLSFPVQLSVAGDTRHVPSDVNDKIKELAQRISTGSSVHFLGLLSRPQIETALEDSDCLICWQTAPHFARPVFEAWLKGVPTLVSKTTSMNILIDEHTSWIGKSDLSSECSELLQLIKENPKSSFEKSSLAFARAQKVFGPGNADRVHEILKEATLGS